MPVKSIPLKRDTEQHRQLLEKLMARKRLSENKMQQRYEQWEKNDEEYNVYLPERSQDAIRQAEKRQGEQHYVDIEVPLGYAMIMSAHTYLVATFLSRSPVLQFMGRHGEPEMNVRAVEAFMDYNTQVGGHIPVYYGWFLDTLRYGIGIVGAYWDQEIHQVSRIREQNMTINGVEIAGRTRKVRTVERAVGYEGNRLFNIRPYDYLPDVRVPLSKPQEGEFVGWKTDISWNTILKRKASGQYVNTEGLKDEIMSKQDIDRYKAAHAGDLPGENVGSDGQQGDDTLISSLPAFEMVVELSPKEWELGSTTYPEKWVFTVVDDRRVIEAHPLGAWHNRFPVEVTDYEYDPYTLFKKGMPEYSKPMNDVVSWLINSHFYAVRNTLNGTIIYDPSRVSSRDVLDPGPGRRIRMREGAYGQSVQDAVHVVTGGSDVTGSHLQDAQTMNELLQRVTGVTDNIMGVLDPGGRKTATEVRTASTAAVNRLRTLAEYISAQGFSPLTQQMLGNARQYYEAEKKFRLAGDQVFDPMGFATVTPDILAGEYDFVPVDGTLPIDRFAQVNMWAQLFGQLRNMPQVAQQYDISKIFAWVAQLAGIKNIQQFRITPVEQPSVGAQPVGQPGAGGAGGDSERRTSGAGGSAGVTPIPSPAPGVGRSG